MAINNDLKKIEIDLLLDAIYQRYGYDFKNYLHPTVNNRLEKYRLETDVESISDMIPKVLHDKAYFEGLLLNMSVTVTEMFRDPLLFKKVFELIIPQLKTYPYVNIWNAGCATGEEVYSMAILLKENNMLHRSLIYGTDINHHSLKVAKKGIYPMERMNSQAKNYIESGGKKILSDYYTVSYNNAKVNSKLQENITFAQHNLVTDGVFAEMHLIQCKNVLIYFNKELQNRVLRIFTESLCYGGYLCLGSNESLDFTEVDDQYELIDKNAKIYRKKYK